MNKTGFHSSQRRLVIICNPKRMKGLVIWDGPEIFGFKGHVRKGQRFFRLGYSRFIPILVL